MEVLAGRGKMGTAGCVLRVGDRMCAPQTWGLLVLGSESRRQIRQLGWALILGL